MRILREWRLADGHRLALVRESRRAVRRDDAPPFVVLWLQMIEGDVGKVKELDHFATERAACAWARALVRAGRAERDAA